MLEKKVVEERDFLSSDEKEVVAIFKEAISLKFDILMYSFNNSERRKDLKKIEELLLGLKNYLEQKNLI